MWQKLNAMPYFFDDSMRNPYSFEAVITAPTTLCFLLGGPPALGIAYAFGLDKDDKGEGFGFGCAVAIWDKTAMRHVDLIGIAIKSVFASHWKPRRAFALICSKNTLGLRFAMHLGFIKEGDIRQGLRYHSRWEDVTLMGVLREEVI